MYIQIANPIYDAVFKYLMEDNKIAKLIISTIIEEEIETLTFLPQERTLELTNRSLTVYRLDFSARIKTKDGDYKNVIIEIQKAKFATDVMRFRRYLGEQYKSKDNYYIEEKEIKKKNEIKEVKEIKRAMPILGIYFLGHKLEYNHVPVIKVKRKCYDIRTNTELTQKENFIEGLTHDSYIIQIPCLSQDIQTEAEELLSIFDQSKQTDSPHILKIDENLYDEKYKEVIRRLERAIANPEIRDTMDVEDDILEELQNMERAIEKKDSIIQEKDFVIQENQKAIQENQKAIQEKDSVIQENQKALQEKDLIIKELQKRLMEK